MANDADTKSATQAGAEPTEPGWYWARVGSKWRPYIIVQYDGFLWVTDGGPFDTPRHKLSSLSSSTEWGPRIPEPGAAPSTRTDTLLEAIEIIGGAWCHEDAVNRLREAAGLPAEPIVTEGNCGTCHGFGVDWEPITCHECGGSGDSERPSEPGAAPSEPVHVVHHVTCPVHEDQIAEMEAELAEARAEVERLQAGLDLWRENFNAADTDHHDALDREKALRERVRELEAALRNLVVAEGNCRRAPSPFARDEMELNDAIHNADRALASTPAPAEPADMKRKIDYSLPADQFYAQFPGMTAAMQRLERAIAEPTPPSSGAEPAEALQQTARAKPVNPGSKIAENPPISTQNAPETVRAVLDPDTRADLDMDSAEPGGERMGNPERKSSSPIGPTSTVSPPGNADFGAPTGATPEEGREPTADEMTRAVLEVRGLLPPDSGLTLVILATERAKYNRAADATAELRAERDHWKAWAKLHRERGDALAAELAVSRQEGDRAREVNGSLLDQRDDALAKLAEAERRAERANYRESDPVWQRIDALAARVADSAEGGVERIERLESELAAVQQAAKQARSQAFAEFEQEAKRARDLPSLIELLGRKRRFAQGQEESGA